MATLSSPTLTECLSTVRSFLNQTDSSNSFWTDAELTSYLNEAIRIYFTEVVTHREGEFTTTTDLDITANTQTVALPTDFFRLRCLWKKVTDGFAIMPYNNRADANYSTQGGTSSDLYTTPYYLRGNSIVLREIPNFSETAGLKLEYVQFPETMVTGGDYLTAQVSPVFKQLIEMYAVYKAKVKESTNSGMAVQVAAEQNLAAIYKQFKDCLQPRSLYPTYVQPFNPEV